MKPLLACYGGGSLLLVVFLTFMWVGPLGAVINTILVSRLPRGHRLGHFALLTSYVLMGLHLYLSDSMRDDGLFTAGLLLVANTLLAHFLCLCCAAWCQRQRTCRSHGDESALARQESVLKGAGFSRN